MKKYKVREHFVVHLEGASHAGGEIIELNDEQAEAHAAQIEEVSTKKSPKSED